MTETAPITAEASPSEISPSEPTEPSPTIDLARLGERLGRYQLVLRLAEGGMGVVFAARLVGAHGVERLVAIKTLRPMTSLTDRTALLREAQLTARLHHKNVVATLDLGEVDDVPYVVMELVDGVSMARLRGELKERDEKMPPDLAAFVVMQSANGLHAAHELLDPDGTPLALVHRDVSPQNILLSTQGEVKIADFGIAKYVGREESTATGMIKGKFGYMSPEQASSGEIDRRSDVFALGIVLWEALTAQRLFSSDTPARTILKVIEHQPTPPIELRPEVGEELSAIAMKCLAKNPDERYPTAAALADALRGALRARGGGIDEGDLGALVKKYFGDERARIMERIRTEPPIRESLTATALEHIPALTERPDREEKSGVSAVDRATTDKLARSTGEAPKSRAPLIVGALAAVGGVAVFFAMRTNDVPVTAPPAAPITSTGVSATPSSSLAPPTPTATTTTTATATVTPTATSTGPTTRASGRPTAPPKPSAAPPPSAKPSATATAPAPKPSSTVGQPFETL